eukprot:PhF_6_TR28077/c0_g1_i1/m.41479
MREIALELFDEETKDAVLDALATAPQIIATQASSSSNDVVLTLCLNERDALASTLQEYHKACDVAWLLKVTEDLLFTVCSVKKRLSLDVIYAYFVARYGVDALAQRHYQSYVLGCRLYSNVNTPLRFVQCVVFGGASMYDDVDWTLMHHLVTKLNPYAKASVHRCNVWISVGDARRVLHSVFPLEVFSSIRDWIDINAHQERGGEMITASRRGIHTKVSVVDMYLLCLSAVGIAKRVFRQRTMRVEDWGGGEEEMEEETELTPRQTSSSIVARPPPPPPTDPASMILSSEECELLHSLTLALRKTDNNNKAPRKDLNDSASRLTQMMGTGNGVGLVTPPQSMSRERSVTELTALERLARLAATPI